MFPPRGYRSYSNLYSRTERSSASEVVRAVSSLYNYSCTSHTIPTCHQFITYALTQWFQGMPAQMSSRAAYTDRCAIVLSLYSTLCGVAYEVIRRALKRG